MIALIALLLQTTTPPMPAPVPPQPAPHPTADALDWPKLPAFPWRVPPRYDPATARFVAAEVAAGRCRASQDTTGRLLTVEVAVRIDEGGSVGAVRPRAIGCPAIEQYTAGIVSRMARDNVDRSALRGAGWYRVVTPFAWRE